MISPWSVGAASVVPASVSARTGDVGIVGVADRASGRGRRCRARRRRRARRTRSSGSRAAARTDVVGAPAELVELRLEVRADEQHVDLAAGVGRDLGAGCRDRTRRRCRGRSAAARMRWARKVLDAPAPQTTRTLLHLLASLRSVRPMTRRTRSTASRVRIPRAQKTLPQGRKRDSRATSLERAARWSELGSGATSMTDKYERLLDYLSQADGWVTAPSSPTGWASRPAACAATSRPRRPPRTRSRSIAVVARTATASTARPTPAFRAAARSREPDDTPRDRLYQLVRRLGEAPDGLDVSQPRRRALRQRVDHRGRPAQGEGCSSRRRPRARPARQPRLASPASEANHRRLLSRMFRDESAQGFLELERRAARVRLREPRRVQDRPDRDARRATATSSTSTASNNVLLHVAIAVDRAPRHGDPSGDAPLAAGRPGSASSRRRSRGLVAAHFAVSLSDADLDYLAVLLTTRVITPGHDQPVDEVVENYVDADDARDRARASSRRCSEEYLVDLDDEELHGAAVAARAQPGGAGPRQLATRATR